MNTQKTRRKHEIFTQRIHEMNINHPENANEIINLTDGDLK